MTACHLPRASPTPGPNPLLQPGPKASNGAPMGQCALAGTPQSLRLPANSHFSPEVRLDRGAYPHCTLKPREGS